MTNAKRIKELRAQIKELQDELETLIEDDKLDREDDDYGIYKIYTDGSCLGNVSKNNPPAGWGIVVVDVDEDKVIKEDHGAVITDRNEYSYIGADKRSNNTAELTAIYYALKYVALCADPRDTVTICFDSVYAANSIRGIFNGKKNKVLIDTCKGMLASVKCKLEWQHVKAHSGEVYNERVDELAKEGAMRCNNKRKHEHSSSSSKKQKF
jgi:ribonuclease HI